MNVLSRPTLEIFWTKHADSRIPLEFWYNDVKKANWKTPQEIKKQFSSTSFLSNNRVVFDIKGNAYRIICSVSYSRQALYIKFIGTHAEYDKIDANKVTS